MEVIRNRKPLLVLLLSGILLTIGLPIWAGGPNSRTSNCCSNNNIPRSSSDEEESETNWGWGKTIAATVGGLFGLKMLTPNPQPQPIYYSPENTSKPSFISSGLGNLHSGINLTFKIGAIVGFAALTLYCWDKFYNEGQIARKIGESTVELKRQIRTLKNTLTGQIDELRNDVDDFRDDVNSRLDRIEKNTAQTKNLLEQQLEEPKTKTITKTKTMPKTKKKQ